MSCSQTNPSIETVVNRSADAFEEYRWKSGAEKAAFLDLMADEIESKRSDLVLSAIKESHLPEARLMGELTRTTSQLKLFATLLREGSWVEAAIDPGDTSNGKPDIRKMLQPIGPIVVFGASNFPFAFSTAGGDSASVLAAGCSLIIKGHPAHPETSLMMFEAMKRSVEKCGMPEFLITHVANESFETGKLLVTHPKVRGVGFTGSFRGGNALLAYASSRENPIPVFAEMGSINPVVFFPHALNEHAEDLARQYAASITAGMGQFCTNPGILLAIEGPDLDRFKETLKSSIVEIAPAPMLHQGIADSYHEGLRGILSDPKVSLIASSPSEEGSLKGSIAVVSVPVNYFMTQPKLREELFGPYSVLVTCPNKETLLQALSLLEGQLTSTLMATDEDLQENKDVVLKQISIAGRVILNDVPTGVAVCSAMVHGGPFPASSDSRFTSVGTSAIKRWVRPVCYQNFPDAFLPAALKQNNPLQIWRSVSGVHGRK